jgi:hypothetical protein
MSARLTIAAVLLASPVLAVAQKLPADCSKAPAPRQPLEISAGGTKFAPKSVKLARAGDMTSGDEQFEMFRVTFESEQAFNPPLEAGVTVLVRKGQALDGKVFRQLAIKDTGKQPAPSPGTPEVQGWSFKNRPAEFDSNHALHMASLRLEFGKRQGDTMPGNITLCVPKGQKTVFDKTPSKEDSYAIGAFQARVAKN